MGRWRPREEGQLGEVWPNCRWWGWRKGAWVEPAGSGPPREPAGAREDVLGGGGRGGGAAIDLVMENEEVGAWVREGSAAEKLNRSWSRGLETGRAGLGQWECQPIPADRVLSL